MESNSSCSQRRFQHALGAGLFLAALLYPQATGAQIPKAAVAAQSAQAPSPEASQDPLGRSTPRGTVVGFLAAAYDHKYEAAAQYLDTRSRGKEGALLAEQLFFVMDRRLPPKLTQLSNNPEGSMSDPLNLRNELVGTIPSDHGQIDISLERIDRPNSKPIWLFSRETLANIPDLYDEINEGAGHDVLPQFLWRKFLGFSLFGWLFFFVFVPLLYVLLSLLNRLLVSAIKRGSRRWARWPNLGDFNILPPPLRLLLVSWAIHLALAEFSTSLVARQVGSIISTLILIVGLVWCVVLINRRFEEYLRSQMERRGRLGSTAILRPTARVIDVIAGIIGFMFALHSFGVNPSAFLAGLGVGGIAVALAAQKTLENVIGGASLILDEAVRVGDYFKMGDVEGTVEAIGLRSTRVRTLTRTLVTIPNGQMATMTLENFSARDSFLFRHTIGIAYDTSPGALSLLLEKVRVLLHDDARVVPASPRVRFLRFAASSLDIEVIAYARARDWPHFLEIQEELLIRIREVIESAGVEIAFPTQSLYLKNVLDPNTVTAEPFYQERTES